MGDELVARAAQLVSVAIAGEIKRTRQRCPIDLGRVELLNYREEVGEEPPLL
jgi:hypothetical protein